MPTPNVTILVLRIGLLIALYAFMALLLYMLWRDLRQQAQNTSHRSRSLARLQRLLPDGTATSDVFALRAVTSVGRAPSNTIQFADDTTSLEHALITHRAGKWWLEDLGSRNGTFLNGEKITALTVISLGDLIQIGQSHLRFEPEQNP